VKSDSVGWVPCTYVYLAGSKILMKKQSPKIQALLRQSISAGHFQLVFGRPGDDAMAMDDIAMQISPLAPDGLDSLAYTCLISSAGQLGYSSKYDILHCLNAKPWYSKPLVDHVWLEQLTHVFIPIYKNFLGLSSIGPRPFVDQTKA
jgi:hypothetical protein